MNSKTELKKFISKILNFPSSEITTFGNGITYSKLLKKIKRTAAEELKQKRIRISNPVKVGLLAQSFVNYKLNLI